MYPDNFIIAFNGNFKGFKNVFSASNPFFGFAVKKAGYAYTSFENKQKDVI